ncbi:hypothetical protein [Metalysinibacillus jejuensis]|uniref:hypothetical protein n=1 Tax=Metalysinibacillus jejuensis TaxID=914327 RepID=UPI000D3D5B96|nr:hypothetical protein [Metalysinibacillus jejuensis]
MSKKVTALSTAAVLAASAIVPVAASAAPTEAVKISHVVFTTENGLASLPMGDYNAALTVGALKVAPSHVQLANGETYKMADYNAALTASNGDTAKAVELLTEAETPVKDQVKPGEVVNGKVVVEGAEVKPPITAPQNLQIITEDKIIADGVTTQVVTFNLLDKNGELDKEANNVVLDLNSTYGFLSQKRLTMQHGTGQVILRSEFLANETVAKIDAQIIEAEDNYKDLIGKIVATKNITFVPAGAGSAGEVVKLKSVVAANSNQADRVTLTFDEEMTLADFYELDANRQGLRLVNGEPVLRNNVEIDQAMYNTAEKKAIRAITIDPKNKKNAVVILEKEVGGVSNVLTDNKDVYVSYTDAVNEVKKPSRATFKLADARVANVTSVDYVSPREITATFSEATHSADFIIDARFKEDTFDVKFGDVEYVNGAWVDTRHIATITLNKNYQEPEKIKNKDGVEVYKYPAGYFASGTHALEVSTIKDFAALTDPKNVGTTQVLEFVVPTDNQQAVVTRYVDSPEQFRVDVDKDFEFKGGKSFAESVQFQVWDPNKKDENGKLGVWVNVGDHNFGGKKATYNVTRGKDAKGNPTNEFKIELTEDWTTIYDTKNTKNNYYNDTFRLYVPAETLMTASNGKYNEKEIDLHLTTINSKDTALATPDIVSPVINDIVAIKNKAAANSGRSVVEHFEVEMSEPVKLAGFPDSSGEPTLAQQQGTQLPVTQVEFLGTYTDPTTGVTKTYTFPGKVNGYVDTDFTDKTINVMWSNIDNAIVVNDKQVRNPQELVDAGGSLDWKVVVKSISDDVGNTAATVDRAFTLDPTEAPKDGKFQVAPKGGEAIGDGKWTSATNEPNITFAVKGEEGDKVFITYTEAVSVTGLGSATNVKNYTLNGKELPVSTTIALAEGDDKTVVISLPKGTLATNDSKEKNSNVITLAKNIVSKEGKVLSYDLSFTFLTGNVTQNPGATQAEKDALTAAIANAEKPETTEGKTEDSIKALEDAIAQAKATLNKPTPTSAEVAAAKKAVEDAVAALKDEEVAGEEKVKTVEELGSIILHKEMTDVNKLVVGFKETDLPADFKSATGKYVLTFKGQEYELIGDGNNKSIVIDYTKATLEEDLKQATITSK